MPFTLMNTSPSTYKTCSNTDMEAKLSRYHWKVNEGRSPVRHLPTQLRMLLFDRLYQHSREECAYLLHSSLLSKT